MSEKRRRGYGRSLLRYIMVVPTLFSMVGNIIKLVEAEAKLAGRSLIVLIVLYLLLTCALTTTWLCLSAMLTVYLVSLHLSALLALAIVLLVNLFVIALIMLKMKNLKNNLSFTETREVINTLRLESK